MSRQQHMPVGDDERHNAPQRSPLADDPMKVISVSVRTSTAERLNSAARYMKVTRSSIVDAAIRTHLALPQVNGHG